MSNLFKCIVSSAALLAASTSNVFADFVPLPSPPLPGGGLLGLAIVGVAGGIWLARRKR